MTGYDNGCGKLCNGDDAHFNLYILSNVEELPEQVQKALIKDEATANKVASMAKRGQDFEKLARKYSTSKYSSYSNVLASNLSPLDSCITGLSKYLPFSSKVKGVCFPNMGWSYKFGDLALG